jgi:ribosomal protein S18 acetylase RimI-like enzyme
VYRVVALDSDLDRAGFSSGNKALDRYFRERVTQDIRRRVTTCFVALDEKESIAGFYTLAATSILLDDLPPATAKRLPRYPSIPAVRMGRLAVDQAARGRGLGGALLADALARSAASDIAAYALIVDAKDDEAVAFYVHHGFTAFAGRPRTLYLSLTAMPSSRR